jgi:SAM-dependent methyltransferase
MMKTRESGMPDEEQWSTFFDVESVLDRLELTNHRTDVVEFGCGYGTFTLPAARRIRGTIYALDIDAEMIRTTAMKAESAGLSNVKTLLRDFMVDGTGCPDGAAGYAMLFNILHAEEPAALLGEAKRVLAPGGLLGIMHWNYDAKTPRGPSMNIRPRPEQCRDWAAASGFRLIGPAIRLLPPFHYGMVFET